MMSPFNMLTPTVFMLILYIMDNVGIRCHNIKAAKMVIVLRIPVRKLKRAHLIGSNWLISKDWENTVNFCSDQIISQT